MRSLIRHTVLPALLAVAPLGAAAQLVFEPAAWDFGRIEEAAGPVSHTFRGVNRGDEPVVILDAVTSCGCTIPRFSKRPVLPGQKTEIEVTYDPANRPGSFTKEVAVYSTERRRIATLTVSGSVAPRPRSVEERYPVDAGGGVRLEETLAAFTYVYPGYGVQQAIGLVNTSAAPVRLELRPRESSGLLRVDYPATVAPGERASITLAYPIPAGKPRYGTLRDALEVVVDDRATGTMIVAHAIGIDAPADTPAAQAPKAAFSPATVRFGSVKKGAPPQSRTVVLANTGGSDLWVRAVENDGRAATTLRPGVRIAPGANHPFDVIVDPAAHDFGPVIDHLVLVTNDPARPMRRLRVTAIVEQ